MVSVDGKYTSAKLCKRFAKWGVYYIDSRTHYFIFFTPFSMGRPLHIFGAVSVALGLFMSASVFAAPATPVKYGPNKLVCFGSCTLDTKGAKGSATLDTSAGGAAGVYYEGYNNSIYGVLLSQVTQLSFTYTGTPTAGSPRFSIPVDEDNNGSAEAFAFVGANLCNNGAGLVDAINDPTCDVNYQSVDYANWAAFVAAYPAARVSFDINYLFVVADDVGIWTVNNVTIGKPGK